MTTSPNFKNLFKIIVREKNTFSQTSDAITQPRSPRNGKGETAPWNLRVAKNILYQTCVLSPAFSPFFKKVHSSPGSLWLDKIHVHRPQEFIYYFNNVVLYMQRHPANSNLALRFFLFFFTLIGLLKLN